MEDRCHSPFDKWPVVCEEAFHGKLTEITSDQLKYASCCYTWTPLPYACLGASVSSFRIIIKALLDLGGLSLIEQKISNPCFSQNLSRSFNLIEDLLWLSKDAVAECYLKPEEIILKPAGHPDRLKISAMIKQGYFTESISWEIQRIIWIGFLKQSENVKAITENNSHEKSPKSPRVSSTSNSTRSNDSNLLKKKSTESGIGDSPNTENFNFFSTLSSELIKLIIENCSTKIIFIES